MERWEYGDPCEVVSRREETMQRQEKACGQCVNRVVFDWDGQTYRGCKFKRRVYGIRCGLYRTEPIVRGA